jgi:glycosyltransferase involved in cell wall biosynthesis
MGRECDVIVVTKTDGSSPTVRRNIISIHKVAANIQLLVWDRLKRDAVALNRNLPVETIVTMRGFGLAARSLPFVVTAWLFRVAARLLSTRWKLAFCHDFEAAVAVWMCAKILRRKYIYHIHDNFTLRYKLPSAVRRICDAMDARFIGDAFAIIVPDASRILPYAEPFRDKILVLPNTFPLDTRVPVQWRKETDEFTVLALGSITQARGIDVLLDAASQVPGVRVLMAGYVGEPALVRRIENSSGVDYRGLLQPEEALRLYLESDIVFMFYRPDLEINRRAAPMKLGEALMMGRPVLINSEVMASSHICGTWGVGVSCPYDTDALARELGRLTESRGELDAMAHRARKVFESEFAWDHSEPALLDATSRALGLPEIKKAVLSR